ncbi:MAG TPA: ribosome small subunit-dependent GTPase A [Lentimicrobium sp.]|nr:ribosome small subunit-dependent GTPase A [Lentimicrobium sp.]
METKNGIVIRSTGSSCIVREPSGKFTECRLKGTFRIKGIRSTNPLAVGDHVLLIQNQGEEIGLIKEIEPRHNYIIRKATRLSKQSHIIAANIDQAIVMATIASPRTSTGFIDRFLVTAEAYHIPAMIIFNKMDLVTGNNLRKLDHLTRLYDNIGYKIFRTSALEKTGIDEVKELLKNKVSLLSGHSGVGKTALINAIEPGLGRKVGIISDYHQKGKHTTTFAEMLPLSFGGYIIDTPGIKEFGLVDFDKQEIAERFPEMRELMYDCQFSNCTHVHEPGCAVKAALAKGKIDQGRYNNYISILNDEYFEETEWD